MAMLRDVFEVTDRTWRGIGMIPQQRLAALRRSTASSTRSSASTSADIHTEESPLCRSGEVLQGLLKPHECAAFGKQCTPAQSARRDDGVVRGRVRRLLRVPAAGPGADLMTAGLDFENWTCPVPLRDTPTVVMGHGGGGAMSGELVEHLFLPGYGAAADGRARRLRGGHRRRQPARVLHRLVRGQADVLPGRLDRRPRGQRHGQRPGHVGRDAAVPVDRVHPAGGHGAGRHRPDRRGDGRGRPGRRGTAGHRRHQGRGQRQRRRRLRQHHRHRRGRRTASTSTRAGPRSATRC